MLFIGLLTAILSTSKLGGVYIITGTCMTQFILCGNYKIYIYGNIVIFICMKYNVPLCIPSRLCFFFICFNHTLCICSTRLCSHSMYLLSRKRIQSIRISRTLLTLILHLPAGEAKPSRNVYSLV